MYVMTRLFPVRHTRHVGKMTKIKIHGADEQTDDLCLLCEQPIIKGELVARVPLGPGADEKAQKAAEAGEWFDALAVEIHWGCSGYRR
jgi:hypothetical protein